MRARAISGLACQIDFKLYRSAFMAVLCIKVIVACYFYYRGIPRFGAGNDADFYDSYATGEMSVSVNVWADILKLINQQGWYSRWGVSVVLMVLGNVVTPLMIAGIAVNRWRGSKAFWSVATVVSFYPTVFYYSLDIYRDVFMLFCFVVGAMLVRLYFEADKRSVKFGVMVAVFFLSAFLWGLRPYLAFSFLLSFVLANFYNSSRWFFVCFLLAFLVLLQSFYALDLLAPIVRYRQGFDNMSGGSSFGLRFELSTFFLGVLLKSFILQMLGIGGGGILSGLIFLVEGLPFFCCFTYLLFNLRFAGKNVAFLCMFFIIYSITLAMGNDNLGTAIRLRIFSYIAVAVATVIIFLSKRDKLK